MVTRCQRENLSAGRKICFRHTRGLGGHRNRQVSTERGASALSRRALTQGWRRGIGAANGSCSSAAGYQFVVMNTGMGDQIELWILAGGIASAAIGVVLLARAGQLGQAFDLEHWSHNRKAPIASSLVIIGAVLIAGWFIVLSPGIPGGVFRS